jgi:acyl dehydratase
VHLSTSALDFELRGVRTRLNYGYDKIRFTSPVPVNSRVRARFTLSEAVEKSPGQWRVTFAVTVQIEGAQRPALVADWVRMWIVDTS